MVHAIKTLALFASTSSAAYLRSPDPLRNVVSRRGDETQAAHTSNEMYDLNRMSFGGPDTSSQLRDKYDDADVASRERGRVHTALGQTMLRYNFNYSKSDDRAVDAWLYMAHKSLTKDENMYIPMLLTVEAGLESFGANVRVADSHDAKDMVKQVRKRIAVTGKAPLVVGVAVEDRYSAGAGVRIMRQCAEAGAYIVVYNTEPTRINNVAAVAEMLQAQEVWDYNMLNVLAYQQASKPDVAFITRYVPPGYIPQVASEASHVNLESSSRDEKKLGFMGSLGYRPEETKKKILRQFGQICAREELGAIPCNGSGLVWSTHVWTWDDYVQWVDAYPMQLNMHRTENNIGLETFRLSMLLNFKACVISALSDPADMQEWKGIVQFVELSGMKDAFSIMTRTDFTVEDCQSKSFSEFKKRFHPKAILQNSGLMNAWHPELGAILTSSGVARSLLPTNKPPEQAVLSSS